MGQSTPIPAPPAPRASPRFRRGRAGNGSGLWGGGKTRGKGGPTPRPTSLATPRGTRPPSCLPRAHPTAIPCKEKKSNKVANEANGVPMRTPKSPLERGRGTEPPLCHGGGPALGRAAAPED